MTPAEWRPLGKIIHGYVPKEQFLKLCSLSKFFLQIYPKRKEPGEDTRHVNTIAMRDLTKTETKHDIKEEQRGIDLINQGKIILGAPVGH